MSISIFFESAVVCATWPAESSASDKKFVKNQSRNTISELICLTTYIIQSLGTLGSPTTLSKKSSLVSLTKCKSLNVINNFSILVKRQGLFTMLPKKLSLVLTHCKCPLMLPRKLSLVPSTPKVNKTYSKLFKKLETLKLTVFNPTNLPEVTKERNITQNTNALKQLLKTLTLTLTRTMLFRYRNSRHRAHTIAQHLWSSGNVEKNPGPEDREVRGRPPVMVTSYNVRGLNGNSKLRHLVNHLYKINKGKDVDFIACLQETYLMNPKSLTYLWRGNLFLTPGNGNSCGCITFLSSHLNVIASRNIENRAHVIVCQRTGETNAAYIIANIYAPNPNVNSKIEFFEQVFDTVNEFEESFGCENSLILGDFNLVFNEREIKNRNHSPQERRVASAVKLLIDSNNLSDIWESKASFTWNRANSDIFSTIDRILYKKANLETRNINVNWAVSNSDHAAVEVSFAFTCKPMKSRSRIARIDPYLAKDPTLSCKLIEGFN